ncbi:MAG: transposase zinc-binding domain-containing protein [Gallintestinimicrobium sp.]
MENIDKMIHCGDPSFGGAMYGCPHCGKLKFVPFRCHSCFCPTCGNKYTMDRTTSMSFSWLMSHIAIVFSQSMKIFVNSFSKIVLCSIVCFTL